MHIQYIYTCVCHESSWMDSGSMHSIRDTYLNIMVEFPKIFFVIVFANMVRVFHIPYLLDIFIVICHMCIATDNHTRG